MHTDILVDQADGLRKLLLGDHYRVVTMMAGKAGLGRTSAIISLAAALATSGKRVLVLDENCAPENIASRLRLPTRHDFLDVLQGRCRPAQAVHKAAGFVVLSTARAIQSAAQLQHERGTGSSVPHRVARSGKSSSSTFRETSRQENMLSEAIGGADLILVDAAISGPDAGDISASGTVRLIMVDGTPKGITEGYASIKRMALEYERQQFEIVINRVASAQAADTVYDNMARLARRDLAVRLELLGWIPRDENIGQANRLGKPVVDLFPSSPSAISYIALAQKIATLPLRQDEAEGHACNPIHDLITQSSHTQYRHPEKLYTL